MIAKRFLEGFFVDDDGAVTIDWVMLTSAVMLLGVLVANIIESSLADATTGIASVIDSATTAFP